MDPGGELLQKHGFVLSAEASSRLDVPGKGPEAYPDAPSAVRIRAGRLSLLKAKAVPMFSALDPLVELPSQGPATKPSPRAPNHDFM